MGTNYYLVKKACPHCKRGEQIHIGKSSGGWCFSLHVANPEYTYDETPKNLEEWAALFSDPGNLIKDEYDSVISTDEMLATITQRRGGAPLDGGIVRRYYRCDIATFLNRNDAQVGPNNLFRRRIGRHCIGHGDGTYDLCVGDFS